MPRTCVPIVVLGQLAIAYLLTPVMSDPVAPGFVPRRRRRRAFSPIRLGQRKVLTRLLHVLVPPLGARIRTRSCPQPTSDSQNAFVQDSRRATCSDLLRLRRSRERTKGIMEYTDVEQQIPYKPE